MARADLLLQLVEAALGNDTARVRTVVETLAAEERSNRHTVLADNLLRLLRREQRAIAPASTSEKRRSFGVSDAFLEVHPKRRISDLVLPEVVHHEVLALIEEQHRADLLRAYNLEPRHRVLLVGPPGNGKTSCAEAIAAELSVPLLLVRYESVITSFLGETSARIGAMLDDVRTRHCVLFLDEFDTMAKERGDEHDTGEIKRVVSTLLLQMDRLPSHVVVCAATNHSELLDRAVWRRFQLRLELPPPTRAKRATFIESLCEQLGMRLGRSPRTVADKLTGASYAELEEFVIEVRRREILSGEFVDGAPQIVDGLLGAWHRRAVPMSPKDKA